MKHIFTGINALLLAPLSALHSAENDMFSKEFRPAYGKNLKIPHRSQAKLTPFKV